MNFSHKWTKLFEYFRALNALPLYCFVRISFHYGPYGLESYRLINYFYFKHKLNVIYLM